MFRLLKPPVVLGGFSSVGIRVVTVALAWCSIGTAVHGLEMLSIIDRIMKTAIIALLLLVSGLPAAAQLAFPPAGAIAYKDTSSLKPPAGATVPIVEFEDLECPLCAQVSPLVRGAMSRYQIPRVHHDFIIQGHEWSRPGAVYARYLEDKVGAQTAEQFRSDVFASQRLIASRDDMDRFARRWFQAHGVQMPFVLDPTGHCAAEVQADCELGLRVGIQHTPTLFVVTPREWIEVTDPSQLYAAIDRAKSDLALAQVPPRARKGR